MTNSFQDESNKNSIDSLSFYELCDKAGFVKNKKIDTSALAEFYGKSERTIYRMLAVGTYHEMNVKLLKLQVLNIELRHQVEILTSTQGTFGFIHYKLNTMNKESILKYLDYPIIKKRLLTLLINSIVLLYKRLDK